MWQGQKRQAEMVRMERQHQNQQAVLRRKAEEASAANNRLKEVGQISSTINKISEQFDYFLI